MTPLHLQRFSAAAAFLALFALPGCEMPATGSNPAPPAPTAAPVGDTTLLGIPPEAEREPLLKKHTAEQLGGGAMPADIEIETSSWGMVVVSWTAVDQRDGQRYEGSSTLKFDDPHIYPEPTDSPD